MTRRVLRGFNAQVFAEIRRRNGISVNDLARVADVSPATIFNWEAGKATPQVDLLARVMRVLDTAIEQVVTIPADERYPGDWRILEGLTQPELAVAANIPTTTLRDIERANRPLNEANATKLAQQLGITVEEYKAAYQRARHRPPGAPV
ncbi:helix-turn-helix transcriptional regulator [Mycobacterium riyadhense]|uniref:helix-turn-helix transcriptional regulator n=1 Tax=Mycobacterium riyadhense TaxID=486698 RepID=UPI00195C76C7|nr:helix-turn-helix transcriptional regulator [Mycobacterium riyadhense]